MSQYFWSALYINLILVLSVLAVDIFLIVDVSLHATQLVTTQNDSNNQVGPLSDCKLSILYLHTILYRNVSAAVFLVESVERVRT